MASAPRWLGTICAGASIALVLAACTVDARDSVGASHAAIVGGEVDVADPAVVRIASSNCSGTLVGSRAVLTAAHCKVAAGAAVSFSDGKDIAALAFHAHPHWDPSSASDDIAIVVLAEPSSVTPLPLASTALDDRVVGQRARIVGYGTDGDGGASGTKRTGFTTITSFDATTFTDSAQPSATCAGDSGGPALLTVGGVELVAGVTSRGDESCRAFGVKTRVDAYATTFLAKAIAATEPGALAVGASCDGDFACASGRCIVAVDSARVHYCSSSCSASADCPSAMRCRDGACRYDPPSPGALGASCEANGDCAGGLCVARALAAAHTCSVLCNVGATSPCPDGFECAHTADGASACFARPAPVASHGGCALAPRVDRGGATARSNVGFFVLALALLLARARAHIERPRAL